MCKGKNNQSSSKSKQNSAMLSYPITNISPNVGCYNAQTNKPVQCSFDYARILYVIFLFSLKKSLKLKA